MVEEKIQVQIKIERIYLKDASFESPGSPTVFGEQFRPEMKVDINTRVNNLGDNRHEVVLSVTVNASRSEDRTTYIVEVQQAGIFVINASEGDNISPVLGVHCPNMLFPYMRENVDSLVTKGGFPPVHLAPVDFKMLFTQAIRQQSTQAH